MKRPIRRFAMMMLLCAALASPLRVLAIASFHGGHAPADAALAPPAVLHHDHDAMQHEHHGMDHRHDGTAHAPAPGPGAEHDCDVPLACDQDCCDICLQALAAAAREEHMPGVAAAPAVRLDTALRDGNPSDCFRPPRSS